MATYSPSMTQDVSLPCCISALWSAGCTMSKPCGRCKIVATLFQPANQIVFYSPLQSHPGTNVTVIDLFDRSASLQPMWKQVEGFKTAVRPIMQKATDGVHFICYSQGVWVRKIDLKWGKTFWYFRKRSHVFLVLFSSLDRVQFSRTELPFTSGISSKSFSQFTYWFLFLFVFVKVGWSAGESSPLWLTTMSRLLSHCPHHRLVSTEVGKTLSNFAYRK